jgi:hypothetical protein
MKSIDKTLALKIGGIKIAVHKNMDCVYSVNALTGEYDINFKSDLERPVSFSVEFTAQRAPIHLGRLYGRIFQTGSALLEYSESIWNNPQGIAPDSQELMSLINDMADEDGYLLDYNFEKNDVGEKLIVIDNIIINANFRNKGICSNTLLPSIHALLFESGYLSENDVAALLLKAYQGPVNNSGDKEQYIEFFEDLGFVHIEDSSYMYLTKDALKAAFPSKF